MKSKNIPLKLLLSTAAILSLLTLSSCGYSKSDLATAEQQGYEQGYKDGYDVGHKDGYCDGYDSGAFSGYDEGYDTGYEEGYCDGLLDNNTEVTEPEGGWPKIEKDK